MQCPLSPQTCWRTHVKQAPLDWWMDLNRKLLVILFMSTALIGVIQGINLSIDAKTRDLSYLMLVLTCACSVTALVVTKCSLPCVTEVVFISCGFLMIPAVMSATVLMSDDPTYRLRTHAISMTLWKFGPAVFGLPFLATFIFIGATIVMDIGTLLLCQVFHDDPFQLRMVASSPAYALGAIAMAFMQMGRLCSIYDAQQALAAEKALMESIISMMCDAIVWLSEDGSTVLRSDARFAMLVGRSAVGEQVARSLPEEEQERLQDCLKRAKEAPVLLPTTLVSDSGARIPVNIFVVGNRSVSEAKGLQEQTPAFLIGIRIASRQGTEELRDADLKQEHSSMLAQTQADGEHVAPEDELQWADHLSSVPETTATGRIFARLDVDRWLQGNPEDRVAELRSGLQRVDALGQSEHWLISERDLELQPKKVLGAGAFGVVIGGWLHGSPVAVKTAKRRKDASVQHLVAASNEIRVFRHIRHPNITLFHGACVEPLRGEVLLVLERVKGPDLCSYVIEHSTDAQVYNRFQLLLDVAVALRYLHSQSPRIIHGDLKGSNVLVEAAVPRAKLVDFGLSSLRTRDAKPLGGSLAWMAPELILRSATRPSPSSDVFSFGRLAYMILACRRPLEGVSTAAIREMARAGVAYNLVWDEGRPLQRECAALCKGMLSLVPEQRPDMRKIHQEASAWTLPDLEERMPAAELARASQRRASAAPTSGGLSGLAANLQSVHDALDAMAGQDSQPDGAGGAGRPAAEPSVPMALPALLETQAAVKSSMLEDVLRRWSCPRAPDSCCEYHAAVAELQRMGQWLMTSPCRSDFAPRGEFQCRSCGVLDCEARPVCPICGDGGTSGLASIQGEFPEPVDGSAGTRALCSL